MDFTTMHIYFVILVHFIFHSAIAQNFIQSCADPLIASHEMREGHPYCEHSCGENTVASCSNQGMCICTSPCFEGDVPLGRPLAPDICPPKATDPFNTAEPTFFLTCHIGCTLECQGGRGYLCGETQPIVDPGNPGIMNFATICNCVCPPEKRCPASVQETTTLQIPNLIAPILLIKLLKSLVVPLTGLFAVLSFLLKLYFLNIFALFGLYIVPSLLINDTNFEDNGT